jgi:hypothetical protein
MQASRRLDAPRRRFPATRKARFDKRRRPREWERCCAGQLREQKGHSFERPLI